MSTATAQDLRTAFRSAEPGEFLTLSEVNGEPVGDLLIESVQWDQRFPSFPVEFIDVTVWTGDEMTGIVVLQHANVSWTTHPSKEN